MVEAFDAAGNVEIFQAYSILLILFGIGVAIEFVVLPLLRRFVIKREWFLSEVILRAVSGQALFWFSFLGLISTLTIVVASVRIVSLARWLLSLLAVLAATIFLVRLVTNAIRLYFLRHKIGSISLLNNALRAFSVTVLIATSLAVVGVPIGPLLTILAGSSIGLSLALREPLANIFSGLTILVSNKIQPGDYIRLSTGQEGFITDIRWYDTYILELTDNLVVVPNALMANTILTNFHRPEPEFTLIFAMGVPYESDLSAVERLVVTVAEEVLREVPGGVAGVEPAIRYNAFGDTGVRFNVLLRVSSFAEQFVFRHEFMKRLGARFAAAGLPPPIPVQRLYVEGNELRTEENPA